jgi:hypothetical protein
MARSPASVTLPEVADTVHIVAGYDKGIRPATVPLPKAEAGSRRIKVSHT